MDTHEESDQTLNVEGEVPRNCDGIPADGVRTIDDTVVFLGAGFSRAAGLSTTGELSLRFLETADTPFTGLEVQQAITEALQDFWSKVFGYRRGEPEPSFEDHFTALDLAANSGHQLGLHYSPRRLRAIRRFSLHRVFELLNQPAHDPDPAVGEFVRAVAEGRRNAVVTTNWDIVVENRLTDARYPYHHGIPMRYADGARMLKTGLPILKLHGSTHWLYCDSCRRVFSGNPGGPKAVLEIAAFLEESDFVALERPVPAGLHDRLAKLCACCGARLSARVATFSYSKALQFFQFQGVWEIALRRLQEARRWLFVGYSLPEADFELRHLLKTAELSRGPENRPEITVVLKDKDSPQRYRRFFGLPETAIIQHGFDAWWASGASS
jgi:NAD-dependent SIR2 family protein deacetylase